MMRTLLCAAACLGLWATAQAEPTPAAAEPAPTAAAPAPAAAAPAAPTFEPTPAQIKVLGDVVPSGGFAHFSGFGTGSCPMPVLYASGASPWQLTLVTTTALEFKGNETQAGPKVPRVQEAFRRAVAKCGFPVPEKGEVNPIKGSRAQPRMMDAEVMKTLAGPSTMTYLSGSGTNFHNLPAVFAMKHGDQAMLVVAGKDNPTQTFALPGQWSEGMKAYAALLEKRGYR